MMPGTHYYVLSLGAEEAFLYEAFRDELIEVDNEGFPVRAPAGAAHVAHMRTVDEGFDSYHTRGKLGLIVVGDDVCQEAFDAVTTHEAAIIGRVRGDRTRVSADDLGQMVWPVVKEVLSAVRDRAIRELHDRGREGRLVEGLEAVAAAVSGGARGALLVEDDYHVRGSLACLSGPAVVSPDVDIRDVNDDAVDAVIELVLGSGGNVVFMQREVLADHGRIVLLLEELSEP